MEATTEIVEEAKYIKVTKGARDRLEELAQTSKDRVARQFFALMVQLYDDAEPIDS